MAGEERKTGKGQDGSAPKKPSKRDPAIVITVIKVLGTIGVAAVTGYFAARPAARSELQDQTGQVANYREALEALKKTAAELNGVPVGTIIASTLDAVEMSDEGGGLWVQADGRPCEKVWAYCRLWEGPLPDLRGSFLRGVNDSERGVRPASQGGDQDNRSVGQYQPDAVGPHKHLLEYKKYMIPGGQGTNPDRPSAIFDEPGFDKSVPNAVVSQAEPTQTQVRNVAVRWFIKVGYGSDKAASGGSD